VACLGGFSSLGGSGPKHKQLSILTGHSLAFPHFLISICRSLWKSAGYLRQRFQLRMFYVQRRKLAFIVVERDILHSRFSLFAGHTQTQLFLHLQLWLQFDGDSFRTTSTAKVPINLGPFLGSCTKNQEKSLYIRGCYQIFIYTFLLYNNI